MGYAAKRLAVAAFGALMFAANAPAPPPADRALLKPELMAAFLVAYEHARAGAEERPVTPFTIRDEWAGIGLASRGDGVVHVTFRASPEPAFGGVVNYEIDTRTLKVLSVKPQR